MEEIPDRALAEALLQFHGGQESALYSVGSCILARESEELSHETVKRAVKELRDIAKLDGGYMIAEVDMLADKLEKWGERRDRMTPFMVAYIEAALWSSSDGDIEQLSEVYSMADISDESINKIALDCNSFIGEARPDDLALQSDEQNGHDLWLTRNRHGAGWWDRGLGEAGERLTALAHKWGECDIYLGDDGQLHFS